MLTEQARGFIQGRQMLENVVDLDSHSRLVSICTPIVGRRIPSELASFTSGILPTIALFDFYSAFTPKLRKFGFSESPKPEFSEVFE